MSETLAFTVVAAPLIMALIEMLKAAGVFDPPRGGLAGLFSLILGVALGVSWQLYGEPFMSNTFFAGLQGAIAGLTASGLYSSQKATRETVRSG